MNGKSLTVLALAIAFGLGAMLLTQRVLSQDPGRKAEETQEVLAAARDIKEEEMLKTEMVKVVRMAKSAIPAGVFSSPKDLEERWVRTALLEGDLIIEKKLGPKGTPPGLVANIPKGMRAFAIDVTEQSGVSGFILPGHRVDVVHFESSDKAAQHGDTILQNILVLAAGQVFTRAEERALTTRTVTLAVTPDQVDVLVSSRARGTLTLALRGVNDHEVVNRPRPKAGGDDAESWEKRWKLEEEKRQKLEQELEALKEALAKKPAPAPSPPPSPPVRAARATPRYATIYRGIDRVLRVRTDGTAVAELGPRPEPSPAANDRAEPDRLGLRAGPEPTPDEPDADEP